MCSTTASSRCRRHQSRRCAVVFSPYVAVLLLVAIRGGSFGHAQEAVKPQAAPVEVPSVDFAAAAPSPSMASRPAATPTTTTTSSSPPPSATPAPALPACPREGDPPIKLNTKNPSSPFSGSYSGSLRAGCTAAFSLDTSAASASCLSSSAESPQRRYLTVQAWSADAQKQQQKGKKKTRTDSTGSGLAPLLLLSPSSGPPPRVEEVAAKKSDSGGGAGPASAPPRPKKDDGDKREGRWRGERAEDGVGGDSHGHRRHEKKQKRRQRRRRNVLGVPISSVLSSSSPSSSPRSPPSSDLRPPSSSFSYVVHPPDAASDLANLAEGGQKQRRQQFVQVDLVASKSGSSNGSFRVAVFAARVAPPPAPGGAKAAAAEDDGEEEKTPETTMMPFVLSWRCDAEPPCPSPSSPKPPTTTDGDSTPPPEQQQSCSGRGTCVAFPSGCSSSACASCDCSSGAGGRDCSRPVRELEAIDISSRRKAVKEGGGGGVSSPPSSAASSEKESVGFSPRSNGNDKEVDGDGSRHVFGIRAPSNPSSSSPDSKGGTMMIEIVRGPGAAASPLLTASVPSHGQTKSKKEAPPSSSPKKPTPSTTPNDNLVSTSADASLSPHLEYQAIILKHVKPGEKIYATVEGAGGGAVGSVSSPALLRRRSDETESNDGGGNSPKDKKQQHRRSLISPEEGTSLTSNNLISSAADLLFGPSAVSASSNKKPSSPSSASALFASSAALSEPDPSQPSYRVRATWSAPHSDSSSSFLCPGDCSGPERGHCVADGECACSSGFGGWRCQGRALDVVPGQGAAGRLPVGSWAFFRLPRSPAEGLTIRLDARGGGRPLLLARAGGPVGGAGAPDAPPGASRLPSPLILNVASGTQLLRVSPADSSADGGVVLALYNAPAGTRFAGSPLVFAVAVAGSASDAAAAALLDGGGSALPPKQRFPSVHGFGGLGPWAAVSVALAATALCAALVLIARAGVLMAYRRSALAAAASAAAAADAENAAGDDAAAGGGGRATPRPGGGGSGLGLSDDAIAALPTRTWEGEGGDGGKGKRASRNGGGAPNVVSVVASSATTAAATACSPENKENFVDVDLENDDDGLCCVVCCCEFARGDELRVLPCFHEFHSRCIDSWLRGHASCPVCRRVPVVAVAGAEAEEAATTSTQPTTEAR